MSTIDVLPPSPPTTSSRNAAYDPQVSFAPPVSMSTPEDSPASWLGSSGNGSRKKVEFSSWTSHAPAVIPGDLDQAVAIKTLPPSRESRAAMRSILKPSSQSEQPGPGLGMDGQQEEKPSMNEAMESIIQQLSKNDKATSLDAYHTLASLLKAYDEVPETTILKNKLGSIAKHIRRDLTSHDKKGAQPTDTNLIIQAMKVLIIVVWNREFCQLLGDDYKAFILDRSIHVINEHIAPKNVIVHYMHLLATQDFRPALVASNTRAARLLDALRELPNHVKGNGPLGESMLVYARFLDQAKPAMKSRAIYWIEAMLMALVSSLKDLRSKAITLGMKACVTFGSSVSGALREVFSKEMEDKMTIATYVCRRLERMVGHPQDGQHVPQIWAIVILLVKAADMSLDDWPITKDWLRIIQRCFNSGDTTVRVQANLAWNRFVCVARPHEASETMVLLLPKPIVTQLERGGHNKQGWNTRNSALSSYCNLLYYAFRPAAFHKQISNMWNVCIVKVMTSTFFEKNSANADFACRVFSSLMWNSQNRTTKVWKEQRAHDTAPVEPVEIPTIDSKWLRAHCGNALLMFKLLFRYSTWGPSNPPDQAFVAVAWKHFAKALGEASSKEIKASSETNRACTMLLEFVQDLWETGPQAVNASEEETCVLLDRIGYVTRVLTAEIGISAFMDSLETSKKYLPPVLLNIFMSAVLSPLHTLHGDAPRLGDPSMGLKPTNNLTSLLARLLSVIDRSFAAAYKAKSQSRNSLESFTAIISLCLHTQKDSIPLLSLQKMENSLAFWLEDRDRQPSPANQASMTTTSIARIVGQIVTQALRKLSQREIESLDALMAAGFSSTHKDTVNLMIEMFNLTHGNASQVTYGPALTEALAQLTPYINLELPDFPQDAKFQNTDPPAFLHMDDTQSHLYETTIEQNRSSPIMTSAQIHQSSDINQTTKVNHLDAAVVSSPTRSRALTPQGQCRYDDSQVHFLHIDSSPPEEKKSQFLTERQREVRDRQRKEAAVFFPDLKSTTTTKADNAPKGTFELGRRSFEQERPTTPNFPEAGQPDFENVTVASPTPRSKQQMLRLDDIEIPSSPPSMYGDVDHRAKQQVPSTIREDRDTGTAIQVVEDEDVHMEDTISVRPLSHVESDDTRDAMHGTEVNLPECEPSLRIQKFSTDDGTENLQPTEPPKLTLPANSRNAETENNEGGIAVQPRQPSETPVETIEKPAVVLDQVAANEDLEMASQYSSQEAPSSEYGTCSDEVDWMSQSQLSQDLDWHVAAETGQPPAPLTEDANTRPFPRKRKRTSYCGTGSKRRKQRSNSSVAPEPAQKVRDEVIYDCIVVDTISRIPYITRWESQIEKFQALKDETRRIPVEKSKMSEHFKQEKESEVLQMPQPKMPRKRHLRSSSSPPVEEIETRNIPIQSSRESSLAAPEQQDALSASSSDVLAQDDNLPAEEEEQELGVAEGDNDLQAPPPPVQDLSLSTNHIGTQTEEDIMSTLQRVLDRIKRASGEGIDLRALDDVCFEIRKEGQTASQRWNVD